MTGLTLGHGHGGRPVERHLLAWHRLRALWRRRLDRQAEVRRQRRELCTLSGLSDATLRDLGLARSELGSIQAEIDGRATATRMRVWRYER
jgi:uncharacterized protein YjiS (DUF1127 family)